MIARHQIRRGSGPRRSRNQTQCPPGKHSLNTTQEAGR